MSVIIEFTQSSHKNKYRFKWFCIYGFSITLKQGGESQVLSIYFNVSLTLSLSHSLDVIWTSRVWKDQSDSSAVRSTYCLTPAGYVDLNSPPFLHILCSSLFSSSVTNPPLPCLNIQYPSLFSSSIPDYLLSLTLSPYSQKTKQIQVEHPAFLPPVDSQAYPSLPLIAHAISKCQLPIPWNTFYLETPMATHIRIPEKFLTRQHTVSTLS